MTVAPADREAAEVALQPGNVTIKGSAVIRQRGGTSVDCAGNDVFLIPATPTVTRELIRVFGGETGYVARGGDHDDGRRNARRSAGAQPHRRVQRQGFFTFDDVRPGKWHVMTSVTWTVGDNYQGGTLLTTAEVKDGGSVEVVLTTR